MDRVVSYQGFHIRPFEQASDCWLAEIRTATGGWIIVRGERREVLCGSWGAKPFCMTTDTDLFGYTALILVRVCACLLGAALSKWWESRRRR
jgi:hypothetical protein